MERMEEQDVTCAVLLDTYLNPDKPKKSFKNLKENLAGYPKQLFPLFNIDPDSALDAKAKRLEKALGENGGSFWGFGESAFYNGEFSEISLSEPPWPGIFEWAGNRELFLMLHFRPGQTAEVDEALDTYPSTTVLMHGQELYDDLDDLLREHKNLYFTLDTSSLLWMDGGENLMYPDDGGNSPDFNSAYDQQEDELLEAAVKKWRPLIREFPGMVLWGTDVSKRWHTNSGTYKRLKKFSQKFVQELPSHLRAKYKFKNAVRLFGDRGVVFEN